MVRITVPARGRTRDIWNPDECTGCKGLGIGDAGSNLLSEKGCRRCWDQHQRFSIRREVRLNHGTKRSERLVQRFQEVSKDLQKDCPGVAITLNQSAADYTVMLNRESKKNRGLLCTNSQVEVANRLGDVLGTTATHTVGNAAKDACQLIRADWAQHEGLAPPDAAPAAAAAPAATPAPSGAKTLDGIVSAEPGGQGLGSSRFARLANTRFLHFKSSTDAWKSREVSNTISP